MTTVAIVHDYLTQRGGAERVLLAMLKALPDAQLYTSLYDPDATFPEFANQDIRTLPMNAIPLLRHNHRLALGLLAPGFSRCRVEADVVLCSSSGWAHGVDAAGRKIVYCHSPARWLYQTSRYLGGGSPVARYALGALRPYLLGWDRRAAASASAYLANSSAVAERIRNVYGIDATVVPPPYAIDPQGHNQPVEGVEPGFVLCVSRLLPYKNLSPILEAFGTMGGLRLVVAGRGPEGRRLAGQAPPNVRFLGTVTDDELRWLYTHSAGLIAASYEDYGLTPLEAAAFGKPAAVLRGGGFLDTVVEDRTGVFFDQPDPELIRAAVLSMTSAAVDPRILEAHVERFSERNFIAQIRRVVLQEVEEGAPPTAAAIRLEHRDTLACAQDVTACIPTLGRPEEVIRTIRRLLSGGQFPGRILVSEAGGVGARIELQAQLGCSELPPETSVELLAVPPCGNRSGNRNWLAAHVTTPFLLFVDDDVDVHHEFLADATRRLRSGEAGIVVANSEGSGGSGWLTFRGHYRPQQRYDPIAVGFQMSLWCVDLYRSLWLDESIIYGYEDADISLRLKAVADATVHQSDYPFKDRGIARGTNEEKQARSRAADEARCYVACRRYGRDRLRLGTFVAAELLANAVHGRPALPAGQVPGQWRDTLRFLVGLGPPQWGSGPVQPCHLGTTATSPARPSRSRAVAIAARRVLAQSRFGPRLAMALGHQTNVILGIRMGHDADPLTNGEGLLARTVARRAVTFIDVGANVGEWTSMFVAQADASLRHGLLFEPSQSASQRLRDRFAQAPTIEIVQAAVSDVQGEVEFFEEPDAGLTSSLFKGFSDGSAIGRTTMVTSIDAEVGTRGIEAVDVLKIDAEGSDLFVLRGARNLLQRQGAGIIQFEYNRAWRAAGATLEAAFLLLDSCGYEVFLLRPDGLFVLPLGKLNEFYQYANFVAVGPAWTHTVKHLINGAAF